MTAMYQRLIFKCCLLYSAAAGWGEMLNWVKSMTFGSDVVFGVVINSRVGAKLFLPMWLSFSKWPPNLPKPVKTTIKCYISSLICKSFTEMQCIAY